jgi:hypothetical protein
MKALEQWIFKAKHIEEKLNLFFLSKWGDIIFLMY